MSTAVASYAPTSRSHSTGRIGTRSQYDPDRMVFFHGIDKKNLTIDSKIKDKQRMENDIKLVQQEIDFNPSSAFSSTRRSKLGTSNSVEPTITSRDFSSETYLPPLTERRRKTDTSSNYLTVRTKHLQTSQLEAIHDSEYAPRLDKKRIPTLNLQEMANPPDELVDFGKSLVKKQSVTDRPPSSSLSSSTELSIQIPRDLTPDKSRNVTTSQTQRTSGSRPRPSTKSVNRTELTIKDGVIPAYITTPFPSLIPSGSRSSTGYANSTPTGFASPIPDHQTTSRQSLIPGTTTFGAGPPHTSRSSSSTQQNWVQSGERPSRSGAGTPRKSIGDPQHSSDANRLNRHVPFVPESLPPMNYLPSHVTFEDVLVAICTGNVNVTLSNLVLSAQKEVRKHERSRRKKPVQTEIRSIKAQARANESQGKSGGNKGTRDRGNFDVSFLNWKASLTQNESKRAYNPHSSDRRTEFKRKMDALSNEHPMLTGDGAVIREMSEKERHNVVYDVLTSFQKVKLEEEGVEGEEGEVKTRGVGEREEIEEDQKTDENGQTERDSKDEKEEGLETEQTVIQDSFSPPNEDTHSQHTNHSEIEGIESGNTAKPDDNTTTPQNPHFVDFDSPSPSTSPSLNSFLPPSSSHTPHPPETAVNSREVELKATRSSSPSVPNSLHTPAQNELTFTGTRIKHEFDWFEYLERVFEEEEAKENMILNALVENKSSKLFAQTGTDQNAGQKAEEQVPDADQADPNSDSEISAEGGDVRNRTFTSNANQQRPQSTKQRIRSTVTSFIRSSLPEDVQQPADKQPGGFSRFVVTHAPTAGRSRMKLRAGGVEHDGDLDGMDLEESLAMTGIEPGTERGSVASLTKGYVPSTTVNRDMVQKSKLSQSVDAGMAEQSEFGLYLLKTSQDSVVPLSTLSLFKPAQITNTHSELIGEESGAYLGGRGIRRGEATGRINKQRGGVVQRSVSADRGHSTQSARVPSSPLPSSPQHHSRPIPRFATSTFARSKKVETTGRKGNRQTRDEPYALEGIGVSVTVEDDDMLPASEIERRKRTRRMVLEEFKLSDSLRPLLCFTHSQHQPFPLFLRRMVSEHPFLKRVWKTYDSTYPCPPPSYPF
ncbi:hypothetical protein BLNAU_17360 [Blattamonas nauphoetae]|uniref:Uncharacterized protein n=1 Tax=Blattamonas nauphoetae TaxID=2049346 RepID=A0ABQ9X8R2_9EUKA|nr:hypothetical protein BLNAU_17360 [Blattamonas nauphoetae]